MCSTINHEMLSSAYLSRGVPPHHYSTFWQHWQLCLASSFRCKSKLSSHNAPVWFTPHRRSDDILTCNKLHRGSLGNQPKSKLSKRIITCLFGPYQSSNVYSFLSNKIHKQSKHTTVQIQQIKNARCESIQHWTEVFLHYITSVPALQNKMSILTSHNVFSFTNPTDCISSTNDLKQTVTAVLLAFETAKHINNFYDRKK